MNRQVVIVGSGFAGLSAACFLAKAGMQVTVLEKNGQPGGRARAFSAEGFRFDMGPSWYWMPDVFDHFFEQFGYTTADFYNLQRLDPSYQVTWKEGSIDIPASYQDLKALFEQLEPGAGNRLDDFLREAEYKYQVSMKNLVYKPGLSITEFLNAETLRSVFRIDLFSSMHRHVRKYFRHPKLLQLAEFPILFLGALPKNTPALYSLMNYADMKLGTWYPMGGMEQIVKAMHTVAERLGVQFVFEAEAEQIVVHNDQVTGVQTRNGYYPASVCIAACDYHYADQQLLTPAYRNYSASYWENRKLSPSSLIFYIGTDIPLASLRHHNLFFDASFEAHAQTLFARKGSWPEDPLMYVCCPSKTDASVAPEGSENLFILIPVAPGLEDTPAIRQYYYELVLQKLEKHTGQPVRSHIIYQRSYAHNDFSTDYHSFKGNAYGLANTLSQTAILKPSLRNKKLNNLYYTGQLTVPGPGVPPSLISGEIVAYEILKTFKQSQHSYDVSLRPGMSPVQ